MHTPSKHQRGVTLVEVLVSVVVLSLGLIGVAGLQTAAINNNQLASQYTNAATLAQNLAERMRANLPGVLANEYNLAPGAVGAPPKNCADKTAECSTSELAQWDLAVWYVSSQSTAELSGVSKGPRLQLPNALVGVACDGACTEDSARLITVYWDADRSGVTGIGCDPDDSSDLRCFTLPFIP